jgi:hypothetical protein
MCQAPEIDLLPTIKLPLDGCCFAILGAEGLLCHPLTFPTIQTRWTSVLPEGSGVSEPKT